MFATITELWNLLSGRYDELFIALSILLLGLEALARLTPTLSDDSALERIGKILKKIMDFLKIPNVKREDGKIITGLHKKE